VPVHDLLEPLPLQLHPVTAVFDDVTGQAQDDEPEQNTPGVPVDTLVQQPLYLLCELESTLGQI
jgi:hypothetical protein